MTRAIVRPEGLDLDSPGRRDYWLALEHDSLWADHLIPLTVMVGPQARPDQGLCATGSNHGNEYEGPVALKHLLSEIRSQDVLGRLILIPVLNACAFRTGTRSSDGEDGVNLNRAFVPGAGEQPGLASITYRIARFMRQYIWPRVHVVLDLHAGGPGYEMVPAASYHPLDDPEQARVIEDTARWFGTPVLLTYQNQTPGLLPSEAERLGKITVGSELGHGASVSPEGVRYARRGVLAAAIRHGQLAGDIQPIAHHAAGTQRKVAMVDRECFVCAPYPGHYEPLYRAGTQVRQGQVTGYLHDFNRIDEPPLPIRAGVDGIIVAQAFRAPVPQGMHVLVVGKVLD